MAQVTMPDAGALRGMADAMVAASGSRLSVARNEADDTVEPEPEAATFLKLDGSRLGRDLEVYAFMATIHGSWEPVLPDMAEELVLPLRRECPGAYAAAVDALLGMGRAVYGADRQEAWADIFTETAPPAH